MAWLGGHIADTWVTTHMAWLADTWPCGAEDGHRSVALTHGHIPCMCGPTPWPHSMRGHQAFPAPSLCHVCYGRSKRASSLTGMAMTAQDWDINPAMPQPEVPLHHSDLGQYSVCIWLGQLISVFPPSPVRCLPWARRLISLHTPFPTGAFVLFIACMLHYWN